MLETAINDIDLMLWYTRKKVKSVRSYDIAVEPGKGVDLTSRNIDILDSGLRIWRDEGVEIPDISYEPRLRGSAYGALREELSYFALCVG